MWQVIQHRYIKGNDVVSNPVGRPHGRRKNARGEAKSNLYSHMEMMIKHDMFSEHWLSAEMNLEDFSITLYDDNHETIYCVSYEYVEVP